MSGSGRRAPSLAGCRRSWHHCWKSPRVHSSRIVTTMVVLIGILAGGIAGGYYWLQHVFVAPGPAQNIVRIQVEQGASVRTVLLDLARQGAIRNPRAIEAYLRVSGRIPGHQPRIQVGMYEIPAGASP